jgi:hypothetical protein
MIPKNNKKNNKNLYFIFLFLFVINLKVTHFLNYHVHQYQFVYLNIHYVMKNKQDITVFVPERRRRSMLVTPGEAKRPGAWGTRHITPTCKVELLRSSERGGSISLPHSRFASLGVTKICPVWTDQPLHVIYFTLLYSLFFV